MEDAEAVLRRFLEWDLTTEQADTIDEVKQTLFNVLGRQVTEVQEGEEGDGAAEDI